MNIAFLGYRDSFDYYHVGGTDSFVRRLALALADQGDSVDLVLYGGSERSRISVSEGVTQSTFTTLGEACSHLRDTAEHVVSIYLRPTDRLTYARFRRRDGQGLVFHHLYTTWNESYVKRSLLFAEARAWPFNGCLFCLSPRLFRRVARWARRPVLLLPPVPRSYFRRPEERRGDRRLRVAYAGRLDPAKGADVGIEALRTLAAEPDYDLRVYGFAWSHDAEGLALQESLRQDRGIRYDSVKQRRWTPQVDLELSHNLADTDVLLLPYRRLSSTIDVPLLLLEAMAALCAVVTPPLGDLHDLYGASPFNLPPDWNRDLLVDAIRHAKVGLVDERARLAGQNASLEFETGRIAAKFRSTISDDN